MRSHSNKGRALLSEHHVPRHAREADADNGPARPTGDGQQVYRPPPSDEISAEISDAFSAGVALV